MQVRKQIVTASEGGSTTCVGTWTNRHAHGSPVRKIRAGCGCVCHEEDGAKDLHLLAFRWKDRPQLLTSTAQLNLTSALPLIRDATQSTHPHGMHPLALSLHGLMIV